MAVYLYGRYPFPYDSGIRAWAISEVNPCGGSVGGRRTGARAAGDGLRGDATSPARGFSSSAAASSGDQFVPPSPAGS